MKVRVLAADRGGSLFYRLEEPIRCLREQGVDVEIAHEIDVRAGIDPKTGLTQVDEVLLDADLIVVQRPLKQAMHAVIRQVRKQDIAVAIEIDDDFHTVHPANIAAKAVDPKHNAMHNYRWLDACLREVDLVTVTTTRLCKYGQHVPGGAVVLPNYIPRRCTTLRPSQAAGDTSVGRDGAPRIGWTGSVATHPNDLQQMGGFFRDRPDVPFHVVGDTRAVSNVIGSDNVVAGTDGWVPGVEPYWQALVDNLDIGVVPLEITPFNQAKSALKGLEMAALGVPFVASPTDAYQRFNVRGAGVLANSPGVWAKYLLRLMERGRFYQDLSDRGREAADSMILEDHVGEWLAAWERAIQVARCRAVTA